LIDVEVIATSQAFETKPVYRRWVGSLLSLLIPGAGIYLAGDRATGFGGFAA